MKMKQAERDKRAVEITDRLAELSSMPKAIVQPMEDVPPGTAYKPVSAEENRKWKEYDDERKLLEKELAELPTNSELGN